MINPNTPNQVAAEYEVRLEQLQARVAELEAENARLKVMEESALKVCGQLDDIVMAMPYDYLDPPDGGNVPMHEQIKRMYSEVKVLRNNVANADELHQQLLIAQADNKRLRDALENTIRHFGMKRLGESRLVDTEIRCKAHEALAQPSDTTTLDAYVAEKVKEATAEFRNAWNNGEWPVTFANDQISTLTRQRDLAVEALDKIGDPWISSVPAIAEFARKVSSTIKESEARNVPE